MGRSNTNNGINAYLDQQERMEAKLQGGKGGGGRDLEGRVRAKAARANGGAANTNASTGTLTTGASTRFEQNSTRYGSVVDSRVNYLSPGVSERMQAKAAGGRGGRGAKYDPRANAVGAYAVAGIGRSESGRAGAVVEAGVRAEGEDGAEEVAEAVECPMAITQVYSIDVTRQTTMENISPINPPSQPILEHLMIVMFSITTMTT